MNYKKLAYGFLVILIFVAIFMLVGCTGDDCGINCDLGACGLAYNGHCGCVGMAVMDECTPVGIGICDDCGSCVGCGIENGKLRLYTFDNRQQYMVGETAIIHATVIGKNSSHGTFDEAVFLKILSDTTGKAKLDRTKEGIELTSSAVGIVTIEAKLGNYTDKITIEFITVESVRDNLSIALGLFGNMYTNTVYQLSISPSIGYVSLDSGKVSYTLSNNTANATMNGDKIVAQNAGSVTVTANFEWEGKIFTDTQTYTFAESSIQLEAYGELYVGNKVELFYKILANDSFYCDPQYVHYSIVSGDAKIVEDKGILYVIARSPGDLTIKVEYNHNGTQLASEKTLTFSQEALHINTESTLYVGEEIALSVTCPLEGFDESKTTYHVVSGNAKISNRNILKANAAGTVLIYAIAEYNGATLTSNQVSLNFSYGKNTIGSAEQLQNLNNSKEEFFLIGDIDLSSVGSWTPIENFSGKLNGNGYTISGLKIEVKNLESNKGLFSVLSGTVENLTINGTITCNGEASKIGLLCGENKGTIKNVTVSGSINASYCDYVGGMIGYSDTSKITNCTANVNVTAREYTGGIAGYVSADRSKTIIFENNANNGEINGTSFVGGIAGFYNVKNGENHDPITINNCINSGLVNGSKNNIGGLFGSVAGNYYHNGKYDGYFYSRLTITACQNHSDISGQDYVGGLFGTAPEYVSEVLFSSNTGNITGNMYVGGYAGYAKDTVLKELKNANTITGKAYVGGIAGSAGTLDSCENNGEIIAVRYYLDNNNTPLSYVGGIVGYANSIVNCTNNSPLDVSNGGYYVGGIVGYLAATRSDTVTIAGNTNNGTISGTYYVGGIAGKVKPLDGESSPLIIISNNKNLAAITSAHNYVGGLFGEISGDYYSNGKYNGHFYAKIKVTECHNEASVSGKDYVGGIVGYSPEYLSEIVLCQSLDDVTGNLYVGGFAGYAKDTLMINLKNSVTVTGKAYVGGIAGYAGKLEKCENNGIIVARSYYLDNNNIALSYVGGLAGYATGAEDCTNNSDIDVSKGGRYVGGIVGYLKATRSASVELKGNINNGAIKGTDYVGGIAGSFTVASGENNDTILVTENKNRAPITSSGNCSGGLFGELQGNYYSNGKYNGQFSSNVRVIGNQNEAGVTGANYVGGIAGNCPSYVLKDEVVWNTNINEGFIDATAGSNKGEFYGAIS